MTKCNTLGSELVLYLKSEKAKFEDNKMWKTDGVKTFWEEKKVNISSEHSVTRKL